MIQSLKITNLYYIYSYEINFAHDENVLILTGPNGFGKTTILQIINNLCSLKLWYFYLLPFDRIEILFDGTYSLFINKLNSYDNNYGDVEFVMLNKSEDICESFKLEKRIVEHMARRHFSVFRTFDTGRLDEYLEAYSNEESIEFLERNMPNMIQFLRTQKCVMIEEQRLVVKKVSRSNFEYSRTVEDIQKKISSFYTEAQKTYNSASLKIDGTFVKRLSDIKPSHDVKHIKKERIYREVQKKILEYKKYDLVGELEVVSELGVHYNEVLKLYLTDLYNKLSSIDKYYDKLSTFDRIVSGKHLAYKKLQFKGDEMKIIGSNEHEIPIRKLSSGEQNLLVLCHNLVFVLDDRNILLIDEPENSLHMAWLQNLLDDYIKIAKLTGCQIIIATHSPAFIHGQWNLTYDLCENGKIQESEDHSARE